MLDMSGMVDTNGDTIELVGTFFSVTSEIPATIFESLGLLYECGPGNVDCYETDSGQYSWTLDGIRAALAAAISGAPDLGQIDYVSPTIRLGTPGLFAGTVGCQSVFPFGCGPNDPAGAIVTISATGDYIVVDELGNTDEIVLTDPSVTDNDPSLATAVIEYVKPVNAATGLPSPDPNGNILGSLLWEPASVPDSIEATIDAAGARKADSPAFGPGEIAIVGFACYQRIAGPGAATLMAWI